MNARTVAAAVAVLALAAPVAAGAKVVPAKHPTRPTHVVTHKQPPRPLCICIRTAPGVLPVESEAQYEAEVDADMVAHGLDPIYGTTTTTTTTDTTTAG